MAGAGVCLVKPIQREVLLKLLDDYPDATNLLIVDDDAGFVQLMVRYLQTTERGYDVRWAYDGERALTLLRESPPDLLLLDLVMPTMGGLDLLRVMQSDATLAGIPVVIVTATDYAYGAQDDRPRTVQIHRSIGFGSMETMQYLAAVLDASPAAGMGAIAPAPAAGSAG